MNKRVNANSDDWIFIETISESGEPLFDILERDGVISAEFRQDVFIKEDHIHFIINVLDVFARKRGKRMLLLLDFSHVGFIENGAIIYLNKICNAIDEMEPQPYFEAVSPLIPMELLGNFLKA